MGEVFDFLRSALPWVAIGLFVACSCATVKTKNEGKEMSKFFQGICRFPAVCFLFTAIMEMLDGKRSNGTVWLVLGVSNVVIKYANTKKEEK